MNITAQLDQLSTAEKISTMEYLWDDLCRHADKVVSPAWHGEVLAQRELSVAEGGATYRDCEAEKTRIRSQCYKIIEEVNDANRKTASHYDAPEVARRLLAGGYSIPPLRDRKDQKRCSSGGS